MAVSYTHLDVYKRQIQKFEGKNVKLHYKEKENTFPWQGDTDYLVYKVEPVN